MRHRTLFIIFVVLVGYAAADEGEGEGDNEHDDEPIIEAFSEEELTGIEGKLSAFFFAPPQEGLAEKVFAQFDRNNDGSLQHRELAHIMKEAGVGVKDGGRHELALASRILLDANADDRVDANELQRVLDLYAHILKHHGSIAALASPSSSLFNAAVVGDLDAVRKALAFDVVDRLLKSWGSAIDAWEDAIFPDDNEDDEAFAADLVRKGDRGNGRKDGLLSRGELRGLLKREFGMTSGGPSARAAASEVLLLALDMDGNEAVSAEEISRARGVLRLSHRVKKEQAQRGGGSEGDGGEEEGDEGKGGFFASLRHALIGRWVSTSAPLEGPAFDGAAWAAFKGDIAGLAGQLATGDDGSDGDSGDGEDGRIAKLLQDTNRLLAAATSEREGSCSEDSAAGECARVEWTLDEWWIVAEAWLRHSVLL